MKAARTPSGPTRPLEIPPEIAVRCDGPDQAGTFDRGIRAFLAVPKAAVLKDEARTKRRKKNGKH
jgi:hypothetical protein